MIEAAPRRENFTQGLSFVDADGHLWHLPILDETSYDRFESIKLYMAKSIENAPGWRSEGDEPTTDVRVEAIVAILLELLEANYEVSPEILDEMSGHCLDRSYSYPTLAASQALDDHHSAFFAYCFADRNGLDRADVLSRTSYPIEPIPIPGWFAHDKDTFAN